METAQLTWPPPPLLECERRATVAQRSGNAFFLAPPHKFARPSLAEPPRGETCWRFFREPGAKSWPKVRRSKVSASDEPKRRTDQSAAREPMELRRPLDCIILRAQFCVNDRFDSGNFQLGGRAMIDCAAAGPKTPSLARSASSFPSGRREIICGIMNQIAVLFRALLAMSAAANFRFSTIRGDERSGASDGARAVKGFVASSGCSWEWNKKGGRTQAAP